MKLIVSTLALILASNVALANMTNNSDLQVTITEEVDAGFGLAGNLDYMSLDYLDSLYQTNEAQELEGDIDLGTIVNYGKQVWDFIVKNKPVVDIKNHSANALPKGANDWSILSDWKAPKSKVFRVSYVNKFGGKVVDFKYRLIFTYGGNVQGKGAYLSRITMLPAHLEVMWGYKFNASVEVPNVVNIGSVDEPVAAAELALNYRIDTVMKHEQNTFSFFLDGLGNVTEYEN